MNDLEERYELVTVLEHFDIEIVKTEVASMLDRGGNYYEKKQQALMKDSVDVTEFIIKNILYYHP